MNTYTHPKKANPPQDWHKADIKAALEKAGWSLRRLAEARGYSHSMVRAALYKPYPNAERIIADALGLRPQDIWPSRYDERRPKRGIGGYAFHKNNINRRVRRNINKDEVNRQ
ncbi:helix-turn-helix domain-containing protein [Dethiosulfatarculus sandiegensis]|uniref:Transcriptional regulator n=1 Tax=Dethiosulfatarculus sandiegensis TaxID=1429043 RepID=A0A0D2JZM1_9BACT|nr:helix-turn-helix domain-containing protein [Dethiosulfatarculus sandiegensis]KIX14965.1 transcriptional regulator [Dethiosulfatarculus sandiegensis]